MLEDVSRTGFFTLPFLAQGLLATGGETLCGDSVCSLILDSFLERRAFDVAVLSVFCLTSMVSATNEVDLRFDVRRVVTPDSMSPDDITRQCLVLRA